MSTSNSSNLDLDSRETRRLSVCENNQVAWSSFGEQLPKKAEQLAKKFVEAPSKGLRFRCWTVVTVRVTSLSAFPPFALKIETQKKKSRDVTKTRRKNRNYEIDSIYDPNFYDWIELIGFDPNVFRIAPEARETVCSHLCTLAATLEVT